MQRQVNAGFQKEVGINCTLRGFKILIYCALFRKSRAIPFFLVVLIRLT